MGAFIRTYGPLPLAKSSFQDVLTNLTVAIAPILCFLAHHPLFRIQSVQFKQFIDWSYESHAFYDNLTAPATWKELLRNPNLLLLPDTIAAHLENHFPSLVIFHGETALGQVAQCHLFVPESETCSRTYVLLYGRGKHPAFGAIAPQLLNFAQTIVEQDADILQKRDTSAPQKIRLNHEMGMDWVRRNFECFPNFPSIDDGNCLTIQRQESARN